MTDLSTGPEWQPSLGAGNSPNIDEALAEAQSRYSARRPNSFSSHEAAAQFMPGGNTRSVLFHGPFPFRAETGSGATLVDVDGNRLLNLLGEYTAGIFGHDEPRIRDAVSKAMQGGINLGAHNSYEPRFAQRVCERFPAIEKVRFTNSGTEANMMAITASRAATARTKILVFEGGYHGGVFLFKPGIETNAPFPWIIEPYNDCDRARAAIREHAPDLAAVLVEPMQGSGGCIPGTADFLSVLREETEAVGSFLIFDEVMTSRFGRGGAQSLFGIRPDLTTLGKWVGGGMSFGAFGGRSDILDLFDPSRADAIAHAGTFQNNVLTMAAGTVALEDIYTPDVAVALTERGETLRKRLNAIAETMRVNVQVTGYGSLMNVHPTSQPLSNYSDLKAVDDRLRDLLFLDLLEEGYYIAPRGFIALSLALTNADLAGFVDAFERVLMHRRAYLS